MQGIVHTNAPGSDATRLHDSYLSLQRIYSSELQRPSQPSHTQEGFGFSDNPKVNLSAPSFDTAAMQITCLVAEITIPPHL